MKPLHGYTHSPLRLPLSVRGRPYHNLQDRVDRKRLGLKPPVKVLVLPLDDPALLDCVKRATAALKRHRYPSAVSAAVIVLESIGLLKPVKRKRRKLRVDGNPDQKPHANARGLSK